MPDLCCAHTVSMYFALKVWNITYECKEIIVTMSLAICRGHKQQNQHKQLLFVYCKM